MYVYIYIYMYIATHTIHRATHTVQSALKIDRGKSRHFCTTNPRRAAAL